MSPKFTRRRYAVDRAGDHAQHRSRRRWTWITLGCVVVLLGLGALGGVVFAQQVVSVKDDLTAAKSDLKGITGAIKTGNAKTLEATATHVLKLTTHASDTVQNPLWYLAASVPLVGQNVAAVQDSAQAVQILAKEALPPAVKVLSGLNLKTLKSQGGINLTAVKQAAPAVPQIVQAFDDASSQVSGIDRSQLNPLVDKQIGTLLDLIATAKPLVNEVNNLLPTVLDMAGGNGQRIYLLAFQNNAESRAQGGNPGSVAVISVDDGKIKLLHNDTTAAFAKAAKNGTVTRYLPSPEVASLYEDDFRRYSQNYSRTADFPTTAKMFSGLWERVSPTPISGVISIDPIALSYMLSATGPVTLADGSTITSKNAVSLLLNEVYQRFGLRNDLSEAYFSDVSSRVFKKVSSGSWDMNKMLAAMQKGVDQGRIYAWFPTAKEEALAKQLKIDGTLLSSNATASQVGVYINDSSHSKLEYYLQTKMAVTCDASARTVTTKLTMTSSVPLTIPLSGYILGWRNNEMGLPRTTMMLDIVSYALPGGHLTSSPAVGDIPMWDRVGVEKGRQGISTSVVIPAGTSKTISFTTTVPQGQVGPLQVRYTPTVTTTPVTVSPSCSAIFPAK